MDLNAVIAHYPSANLIAYYPLAFDGNMLLILSFCFPEIRVCALSDDEAMRRHPAFGNEYIYSYTLNSLEHSGKVIMPYCAPSFRKLLTSLGKVYFLFMYFFIPLRP